MGVWVITGASGGIGLELCRQARARGEHVVAACRRTTPELSDAGCVVVENADVTADETGPAIMEALGDAAVDVLVNNAGVLLRDSFDELDLDAARRQFEINTLGPLRLTRALLPRMQRGSKIVMVTSRAGSIGDGPSGGMYGYRMSKAALNMASANLAHELAPRGILVGVVHPGFIRTHMTYGAGNQDPPEAVAGILARIDELDAARSGRFFHAQGDEIPW